MSQTSLFSLLKDIVVDNPTQPFPVSIIQIELTALYYGQNNFDSICSKIILKLKRKFDNKVIPHIFFLCLDRIFPNQLADVDLMDPVEYLTKVDELTGLLSRLRITRIALNSPDGLLITEMK